MGCPAPVQFIPHRRVRSIIRFPGSRSIFILISGIQPRCFYPCIVGCTCTPFKKGVQVQPTIQMQSTNTIQPDTRYNLTDPQPFPWSMSSMGTCCVWKFKKGLPGAAHTARQTKVQIFLGLSLPKNMFTLPVWIERSTAYCTGGWGSRSLRAGRIWQHWW